jgi:hypothetical protein
VAVLPSYTTFRALFATTATPVDPDGYEPWPYATKMRAGGFTGGFSGVPSLNSGPIAFPLTVSVDSQAIGAPAFDIYLSQRTDDAAAQPFAIAEVAGKSGTWTISLTTRGCVSIGLLDASGTPTPTASLTPGQVEVASRNVYLYVRRLSDGAMQWADLRASLMGGT